MKNLTQIFDARVWAKEWIKTIKKNPDIPTDESTMVTWFANAIMAGYDNATNKHKKESINNTKHQEYLIRQQYKIGFADGNKFATNKYEKIIKTLKKQIIK